MSRFMDPTTDFGFKKLFGEEANKDLTLSFLNDLLELEAPLLDLSFANPEQLPPAQDQRAGIYDLLCRDLDGNRYLVEMQKNRLDFIKDRLLYYSTFPIAQQAPKGHVQKFYSEAAPSALRVGEAVSLAYGRKSDFDEESEEIAKAPWNYRLKGVYCVAVLGYKLEGSTTAVNYNSLRNDRSPHTLFYDKLRFVTVELPLFDARKPEYNLDRHLHKWLYFLKQAAALDQVPEIFSRDQILQKAFWVAELANFTPRERDLYEQSLKRMWDTYAALTTSRDEGRREGKIEGKIETLRLLFSQKLGPIPVEIEASLRVLSDVNRIDAIVGHFMEINDWETLQKYLA